jgi:hypothetical protein
VNNNGRRGIPAAAIFFSALANSARSWFLSQLEHCPSSMGIIAQNGHGRPLRNYIGGN